MEGHDVVHKQVELQGDYKTPARATKAVMRQLGVEQVIVDSMTHHYTYYSMPIEKFVQLADKTSTDKE